MEHPKRIMVIGCGGSGKSTLSQRLAQLFNLELISLDRHYWHPGWKPTSPDEWEKVVRSLIQKPGWVMDGNYGGTIDMRLEVADMIIFLYYPSWTCLRREISRTIKYYGKVRPGMTEGCPTKISLKFWRYIWNYNKTRVPGILEKLKNLAQKQVHILHSDQEVRLFLASWEGKPDV